PGFERAHLGGVALVALLAAFAYNGYDLLTFGPNTAGESSRASAVFQGMLAYDKLLLYLRAVILGAAALTVVLCLFTGIPDREDSGDFNVLLLCGTLARLFMAS